MLSHRGIHIATHDIDAISNESWKLLYRLALFHVSFGDIFPPLKAKQPNAACHLDNFHVPVNHDGPWVWLFPDAPDPRQTQAMTWLPSPKLADIDPKTGVLYNPGDYKLHSSLHHNPFRPQEVHHAVLKCFGPDPTKWPWYDHMTKGELQYTTMHFIPLEATYIQLPGTSVTCKSKFPLPPALTLSEIESVPMPDLDGPVFSPMLPDPATASPATLRSYGLDRFNSMCNLEVGDIPMVKSLWPSGRDGTTAADLSQAPYHRRASKFNLSTRVYCDHIFLEGPSNAFDVPLQWESMKDQAAKLRSFISSCGFLKAPYCNPKDQETTDAAISHLMAAIKQVRTQMPNGKLPCRQDYKQWLSCSDHTLQQMLSTPWANLSHTKREQILWVRLNSQGIPDLAIDPKSVNSGPVPVSKKRCRSPSPAPKQCKVSKVLPNQTTPDPPMIQKVMPLMSIQVQVPKRAKSKHRSSAQSTPGPMKRSKSHFSLTYTPAVVKDNPTKSDWLIPHSPLPSNGLPPIMPILHPTGFRNVNITDLDINPSAMGQQIAQAYAEAGKAWLQWQDEVQQGRGPKPTCGPLPDGVRQALDRLDTENTMKDLNMILARSANHNGTI